MNQMDDIMFAAIGRQFVELSMRLEQATRANMWLQGELEKAKLPPQDNVAGRVEKAGQSKVTLAKKEEV